jgi:hypothetical protein
MPQQKPEYFRPALTAGAVAGLLSGIPFIGAGNCICCLWIVGGAMIAVKLLARDTKIALTSGDGAVVGALTGIIAAVVDAVVKIPFQSFNMDLAQRILDKAAEMGGQMPAGLDGIFQGASATLSPGWFLLGLFVSAVVYAVFGALGGLIGISLFAKKAAPAGTPPPPPPAIPPADTPGPTDAT